MPILVVLWMYQTDALDVVFREELILEGVVGFGWFSLKDVAL